MILKNVLDGVYAKSTLTKKIKELEEEMKTDFSEKQDAEKIARALTILMGKARGKAKVGIEVLIEKINGGESSPSWDATASITVDKSDGANAVRKPSIPEEEKKSDLQVLEEILKKMEIAID